MVFLCLYIGIKTKLFICINQRQKHIVKRKPNTKSTSVKNLFLHSIV
jgi:hypothetical protein